MGGVWIYPFALRFLRRMHHTVNIRASAASVEHIPTAILPALLRSFEDALEISEG